MPCSHGAEEMFVILPASEPDMEFLQLVWRLVSAPSALCVTPSTEHTVSTEQWGKYRGYMICVEIKILPYSEKQVGY